MATIALLAGSSKYESDRISNLSGVFTDLKRMEALCKASDIRVDGVLRNAGRTRVLTAFRQTCNHAGPNDNLLLYFSGHGHAYRGRDYLVPSDANLDDYDLLEDVLVPVDLKGALQSSAAASITVIIDACREGIELRKGMAEPPFTEWRFEPIDSKFSSAIFVAFSCSHGEFSHMINKKRGSLFSSSFCDVVESRDYREGNILDIMESTNKKMKENSTLYGVSGGNRQNTHLVHSANIDHQHPPEIFPRGRFSRLSGLWHLEENEQVYEAALNTYVVDHGLIPMDFIIDVKAHFERDDKFAHNLVRQANAMLRQNDAATIGMELIDLWQPVGSEEFWVSLFNKAEKQGHRSVATFLCLIANRSANRKLREDAVKISSEIINDYRSQREMSNAVDRQQQGAD